MQYGTGEPKEEELPPPPPPSHPFSPAASSAAASTAISSLSPFRPRVGDRGPSFPTAKRGAIRRQVEKWHCEREDAIKGRGLPMVRGKILSNQTSSVCGKQESAQRGIFANPSQRGNDISAVHGKSQSIMRDEMERGCLLKKHVFLLFWLSRVMVFGLVNVLSVPCPCPWGETRLHLLLTLF